MNGLDGIRIWLTVMADAWRGRRDDRGGVSDEVAMIGLMLVAAVAVGGIIYGLITTAADNLKFD
jgi:hypothetical protein